MGCSCPVQEPKTRGIEASGQIDIQSVIERNVQILQQGEDSRELRFPELRDFFSSTKLISTFSHLNLNLAIDEVYGNYVFKKITSRVGIPDDQILNAAYDNLHPGHDAPKGHRIQYVIINPVVLDPERVIHLQKEFKYDPNAVIKDGQNRIKSAPEQNIEAFRERYDQIDSIYQKYSGSGDVAQRILNIRNDFLKLTGIEFVPEKSFSQALTRPLADVLEYLFKNGHPFWEMPVPEHRDRYIEYTYLVEGVDSEGRRKPARFENAQFIFEYNSSEKHIPQDEIFDALRNYEVIPTMPLVILTTATAPQMPHLGGGVWKKYAAVHVDAQAEWLGIPEKSDTLILSTDGHKPLMTYRDNQDFTGFPAVYLTYGHEMIQKSLHEGLQYKVEFKRIVF
ncbi:hypothetical protein HY229_04730 [Candidatus Acetothermia bacterium]|nr:hypothetical protein [Candidatus Acetothermia bacterium]MBI3643391.1 hypothetical protein [Candidatus Acetothermia bacterium]